jgi:nicotinamide mononucleotide transporter
MSGFELFGFITGVICVYLIVKENDWNWSIGIVNSILLLVVMWKANLFAQVGLQALYVVEGFFGWYKWLQRDKVTNEKKIKINFSNNQQKIIFLIIGVIGTLGLWKVFMLTADPSPFIDSLITTASIIAELMLCWKFTESWIIYLLSDILAIELYISLGLCITAGTYLAFLILCIMGAVRWTKIYKERKSKIAHVDVSSIRG